MDSNKISHKYKPEIEKIEEFEGGFNMNYSQVKFCFGMFKKMVFQNESFIDFLKTKNPTNKEIEDVGRSYLYEKAYIYLSLIKLHISTHFNAVADCIDEEGLVAIIRCIKYFEATEEYEKCTVLKEYEDFFKLSLASKK